MPKTKISEFDVDPANNTDINSINIAEGCAPSGINNAIRQLMSDLKEFQTGAGGDPFNGAVNGTVGATTPNTGAFTTLSASGVATVSAGSVSAPAITTTGDTNTGIFFPAADTIAFTEGGTEAMRIDSSGNVGIGVTPSAWATLNPVVELRNGVHFGCINSATPLAYFGVNSFYNGSNWIYKVSSQNAARYEINASGDGSHAWFSAPTGTAGNVISFSERMRIDSSGNVGIGTSSPQNKLQVLGTIKVATGNAQGILGLGDGAGATINCGVWRGAANAPTTDGNYLNFGGYDGLVFATGNAAIGSQTERMRIDSSGNLLVGTTAKLQDDNKFVVQGSGGNGGNGIGIFYNTGIDSSPSLVCSKGSTTTSSSARFIQFYAGGVTTTAMGGIVGNGASNVQFASLSDAREKTNIQSISGSLEKINALNPVEFDWITDGSHIKAGFVAQEVEQVFPEFVVDNMSNDGQEVRKGLTGGMTGGIVAHLVKAIQELKTEVDALKSRIETLESK
jgi:hypothetical protein